MRVTTRLAGLLIPMAGCVAAGAAVPSLLPPLWVNGRPDPQYGGALDAAYAAIRPDQRDEFFTRLRAEQRRILVYTERAERDIRSARGLAKDLQLVRNPAQAEADRLVESLVEVHEGLLSANREIQRLRLAHDPQKLDAEELQVDLYGGFQFSSLYRDPTSNGGFFSKSRPFAALDTRQAFRRIGSDRWLEAFGTLSFQSSSLERSEALNIITTTGNFRAEIGAWRLYRLTERVAWGFVVSTGIVGFSETTVSDDVQAAAEQDHFRSFFRASLVVRQEKGALKGSCAEIGYLRDPLFIAEDRLLVRGRVVLTQFGTRAASGDFYAEGRVNKGKTGRDEAVLLLGFRLSTLSFFRSLGAGQGED